MIESIRLKAFRKHDDLQVDFDPKWNLIHGRNNAGKSTLFYAIEYCLFGNVDGFKKIAQLTQFGSKAVGVELRFQGKDGNIYKLQRMHSISARGKSAKGSYTLKQILPKNGQTIEDTEAESYILSSDFGDRAEHLMLKISELTGISKRFFETGVTFHQGSISNILEGSKKLDIVFGITAAASLSDLFKTQAKDFEQSCKELPQLEALLNQRNNEKKEKKDQFNLNKAKLSTLKNDLEGRTKIGANIKEIKEILHTLDKAIEKYSTNSLVLIELKAKLHAYKTTLKELNQKGGDLDHNENLLLTSSKKLDEIILQITNLEKEIKETQAHIRGKEKTQTEKKSQLIIAQGLQKELDSLEKKVGSLVQLSQEISSIKKKIQTHNKEKTKRITDLDTIQQKIRLWEQEKGNVEGIIKRRKETKDAPLCEYCGAPIDKSKVQDEIKKLKTQLTELEQNILSAEKQIEKCQKKDVELSATIENLNSLLNQNIQSTEQITRLQKKITDLPDLKVIQTDIKNAIDIILKYEKSLTKIEQMLSLLRENEKKEIHNLQKTKTQISLLHDANEKTSELTQQRKQEGKNLKENETEITQILKSFEDKIEALRPNEEKQKDPFMFELLSLTKNIAEMRKDIQIAQIKTLRENLNELIISKESEISTASKIAKDQIRDLDANIAQINSALLDLDKMIAQFEQRILNLEELQGFAKKYRHFQNIFENIQGDIRKNVSRALEQKILEFHRRLSVDDEFERIKIDNEDYSLSVKPKNIANAEFYPAKVYQGGGHKLILGLAYKLALGELIGTPSFLLIDEPTEYMDEQNRINLLSNLGTISKSAQVLLITHQDVDKIQCSQKIFIKK